MTRASRLPSAPQVQARLIKLLESPSCAIDQLGRVASSDPCLTVQVLKLESRAFFGITCGVCDAAKESQLLSVGTMRSLALTFQSFTPCAETVLEGCDLGRVGSHSQRTAELAHRIARPEGSGARTGKQAFTAGLVPDVGEPLLAANWPGHYIQTRSTARELADGLTEAELQTWQTTHADVGAYLLGRWGLPMP